jgi:hypothetical protein
VARKASGEKAAPTKKAPAKPKFETDESMDDDDGAPVVVPARNEAPKRAARATASKKSYIDISESEGGGEGDDSVFVDDD